MSDTAGGNRARGRFVKIDPNTGSHLSSIPFQYNPDTLKRSLQPMMVGGQPGGHSEGIRFGGVPTEIFTMNIEFEAFDQLPTPGLNAQASSSGVYPLLYALEMLIYPPSDQIKLADQQLDQGTLEIAPIVVNPVLFVWGPKRVVPVVVQGLEIVEQAYDQQLNPLRVVVSVTLRVVSASDVVSSNTVYNLYIQYQQNKESLAVNVPGG